MRKKKSRIYTARYREKYPDRAREQNIRGNERRKRLYRSSLSYFLAFKYNEMTKRVRHEKSYIGRAICTREEFMAFGLSDGVLKILFKEWQDNDFQQKYNPSVDRINSSGGYTIGNIQFITFIENVRKQ